MTQKATICITGSTGFVGLNIMEHYLVRGHDVVSVANTPLPRESEIVFKNYAGALHHEVIDVGDLSSLKSIMLNTRPDGVIIGAAVTPADQKVSNLLQATLRVNVIGALNTLEAASHLPSPNITYLSSASVYGTASPVNNCLSEDKSLPAPQSIYGLSKLTAENFLKKFSEIHSIPLSILRIGTVFGPWERKTGVRETLSPIFQVMEKIESADQLLLPERSRRDYIYSRDVANVIAAVMAASPENRLLNVGFGVEWDLEQWCAAVTPYRKFEWSLAPDGAENVYFHGGVRPPLCAQNLARLLGKYKPYTIEESAEEYFSWMESMRTI